ncbi:hypothetical protein BGX28_004317 [Mortierella sp. GBA30]|nr:hypothetical protein BGX28_004317 [Mortierella sp. GBA30]
MNYTSTIGKYQLSIEALRSNVEIVRVCVAHYVTYLAMAEQPFTDKFSKAHKRITKVLSICRHQLRIMEVNAPASITVHLEEMDQQLNVLRTQFRRSFAAHLTPGELEKLDTLDQALEHLEILEARLQGRFDVRSLASDFTDPEEMEQLMKTWEAQIQL